MARRTDTTFDPEERTLTLHPDDERPSADAPQPKGWLPERYADLGPIGQGGMGAVRCVRDRKLGSIVALKVLDPTLADVPSLLARFDREARITAQLNHPGIVAVHDSGRLADGRPWFAMDLVEGRTLTEVISAVHDATGPAAWGTADGWTLRGLVEAVLRASQAMAYAHARGVVHRDLKPDNLMVGRFGEVRVMDWGIARLVGATEELVPDIARDGVHTRAGGVLGTPAYMAPEQARGELDRIDASTDIYALGAVLYTVLTGRPPYPAGRQGWTRVLDGPPAPVEAVRRDQHPALPGALVRVCEHAMSRDPTERPPTASALAAALQAWLDGSARQAEARALVEEARALQPRIADLEARAADTARAARVALDAVPEEAPAEEKLEGWRLEDATLALRRDARVIRAELLQRLRGALERWPDLPEANAMLADHYQQRLVQAEQRHDVDAAAEAEVHLRTHDRGKWAAWLTGDGAVTLHSTPPGATVEAFRFVEVDRRLREQSVGMLGVTPLDRVRLPRGSYVLVLRHPDFDPLRVPVAVGRLEHWDNVRPGDDHPTPVRLWRGLGPEVCPVPAGWFRSGGDPDAGDPLPARRLWVDGLLVQRDPVTAGAYLRFLSAASERGDDLEPLLPRTNEGVSMVAVHADGIRATQDGTGRRIGPDEPVVGVSAAAAEAYATWWSHDARSPWRLPHDQEWEKCARGVDGRAYPWGRTLDPSFCRMRSSERGAMHRVAVDAYPSDVSPYGIQGLGGNVRDWCQNAFRADGDEGVLVRASHAPHDAEWRMVRGGSWVASADWCRSAGRFVWRPQHGDPNVGFRLVR